MNNWRTKQKQIQIVALCYTSPTEKGYNAALWLSVGRLFLCELVNINMCEQGDSSARIKADFHLFLSHHRPLL